MAKACRYSPRKLLGSGAALASLGCVHALGSLQFKNAFGAAVGALGMAAGAALLLAAALLLVQGRNAQAYAASGTSSAAVLLPRWAAHSLTGFGVWLLLLVLVRIASPDVPFAGFPAACPQAKQLGCSRVAADNSHRTAGWKPVQLPTTLPGATSAVLQWIRHQPRTTILAVHQPPSTAGAAATAALAEALVTEIHARFVSLLWGFADDVFVQLSCNAESGEVLVEVQGQLRVGVGDMEVNVKRNAALMAALTAQAQAGELPAGRCSAAGNPALGA